MAFRLATNNKVASLKAIIYTIAQQYGFIHSFVG